MKDSIYKWILSGLATGIIVVGGILIDRINTLNENQVKTYIRQASENERLNDIEKRLDRKENIDSLKIEIQKLKSKR